MSMNHYTGTFNWHGEVMSFDTEAKTEAKAKSNLLYQLALFVDCPVGLVRKVVADNCEIVKGAEVR